MMVRRDPVTNHRSVDGIPDLWVEMTQLFEGVDRSAIVPRWVSVDTEARTIKLDDGTTEKLCPALHRIVRLRVERTGISGYHLWARRLWPFGEKSEKPVRQEDDMS